MYAILNEKTGKLLTVAPEKDSIWYDYEPKPFEFLVMVVGYGYDDLFVTTNKAKAYALVKNGKCEYPATRITSDVKLADLKVVRLVRKKSGGSKLRNGKVVEPDKGGE